MNSFVVVFEDTPDAEIATELSDRIFCEHVDWLKGQSELLETQRTWITEVSGNRLRWRSIKDLAHGMRLPIRGDFDGANGKPDFKAALRAIHVVMRLCENPTAIILVRDADKEVGRRDGLHSARIHFEKTNRSCPIVIGLAISKRECWVLSGFDPCCEGEEIALRELTSQLGADPRRSNSRLTAQSESDLRNAKRVLSTLTHNDKIRESRCWQETNLATLHERGADNGLADFLLEVRDRLVPIIQPNIR